MLLFEVVIELDCLVPLWEWALETLCSFKEFFKTEHYKAVASLSFLFFVVCFKVHSVWVLVDHPRDEKILSLDIHVWGSLIKSHAVVSVHINIACVASHPLKCFSHSLSLLYLILLHIP